MHQIAGGFDEADHAFASAQELFKSLDPPQPQQVAEALRARSLLALERGNMTQAARFSELCLRMVQTSAPEASILPELLADRAGLLLREGKRSEAMQSAEEALEAAEGIWEPEDPRLPHLLCGVAALYLETDNPGETPADTLLTRALGMNTELFGRDHPAVATVLLLLGQLYIRTQEYDRAVAMLNRALGIRLAQGNDFIYDIANAKNTLAVALIGRGDFEDADQLLEEALDGLASMGHEADPLRDLIKNNVERVQASAADNT